MARPTRESKNLSIKINPEITSQLESFFESTPPNEFRENLLELYHSYILHEHNSLPLNFKELTESMLIFLEFLKFADDEFNHQAQVKQLKRS